ncbi:TRAP transporter large permease [Desulfofalx alkaliphila]|uniref:TRAP transporter large permease n=1 Tax=Desulfofalx alkaliphila TaxID=105483 RepID=UPI0004E1CF6A|nr:TRAP transporter large permease [Desulfofalx alkaliphila]
MVTQVLFGAFVAFLILNVPIGIAVGLASVFAMLVAGIPLSMLAQGMITSVDSFPLMAVPFFILAGNLMSKGGITKRLLVVADVLVGRFHGGLAMVAVATSMFFGAISGSAPATVAAIGSMLIPEMNKAGYDKKFAAAVVAAAGTIGVIIPPSIPMVIYGVSTNASIGDMFIAGIVPGILVGVLLMAYSYYYARKHDLKGTDTPFTIKGLFKACADAIWALLVPVIILGGIYGGVFTPTEAAVVAVVYGFIAGVFIYKELKWPEVPSVISTSALTTATILIIVGTATTFGRLLALESVPNTLANAIMSFSSNAFVIMLLINLLLLFVGMFMETLAAIIILAPILLPLIIALGLDPIHFGIIMVVNLAIGFVSPPVGVNLFVANGISGVPFEQITRAILPFIAVLFLTLFLINVIPAISIGVVEFLK